MVNIDLEPLGMFPYQLKALFSIDTRCACPGGQLLRDSATSGSGRSTRVRMCAVVRQVWLFAYLCVCAVIREDSSASSRRKVLDV